MYFQGLFATCVAAVLCASVVETVEAYPISARSGVTTVTGTYRPLDLSLTVVESANGFVLDNDGYGSLTANMTGTYVGVGPGYPAAPTPRDAGSWRLQLIFDDEPATISGNTVTLEVPSWASLPYRVGTLRFLGGGDFIGLPSGDIPEAGDTFRLFAEAIGPLLEITCSENVATCGSFSAKLLQALTHQGPYLFDGEGYSLFDDGTLCNGPFGVYEGPTGCNPGDTPREPRNNNNCANFPCTVPIDGFRVAGANIPEPASLALVGLGLLGLVWGRRKLVFGRRAG